MANYDVLGNIAIIKFPWKTKNVEKKRFANKFLKEHKGVKTVLEKIGRFKGRLRTLTTKYLAGERTKEAFYNENRCSFNFNVDSCYFSPRLASERNEIASMVKKDENVLVMFGGVAPFAIVIAKSKKPKKVYSVELSRECNKYAKINVRINKIENIELIQGDVRKVVPKIKEKFDRIVMARPNLKDSFLDVAFSKIKNKGIIHYYGFYKEEDSLKVIDLIKNEAKKAGKSVKILKMKKAGDIGVKTFRYRVDFSCPKNKEN